MRLVGLISLLLLLIAPASAHAAPVVPVIAAWLSTVGTAWAMVAQVVLAIATTVYGQRQAKKAARRARDAYNSSLEDRCITAVKADMPHVYVYGRARVGSAVVAIFTNGSKDQYKYLVCVHAAHEVDAIEDIWIAGRKLAEYKKSSTGNKFETWSGDEALLEFEPEKILAVKAGSSAQTAVSVPYAREGRRITLTDSYEYASCSYTQTQEKTTAWAWHHLGTPDDPVDAELHSRFPTGWPATSVLRGFCYTVVKLDLNESEFQSGIPSIEVLIRGKKLYDPRTGETAWSENNALVAYDFLTGDMCGVNAADLPVARYITAANVCDEMITVGKRYTFNGTVTTDEDRQDVLEKIAQSMAGGVVSTTWDIWAGKYVAPLMALDQTDIVGKVSVSPGIPDADLYNGVKGQYVSDENEWVMSDVKPYQSKVYKEADGRDLWTDITFIYTNEAQRIHNLARIYVEDQRNGYAVQAEFSRKAWKLRVGDRVTLNSEFFGWEDKVFRVMNRVVSPTTAIELSLKEDDESIWDEADAVTLDATPNTTLPDPFSPPMLENFACVAGTTELLMQNDGTIVSRILATWTDPGVPNVVSDVEWATVGSDGWASLTTEASSAYLSPVQDGADYIVRARTHHKYFSATSDWVYTQIAVTGKLAPPANITDLTITGSTLKWTGATDTDLKGSVFRFHYGNNTDWGTAAPLHDGVIVSSPFELSTRPSGVVTILGKNVDTSGNESVNADIVVINLGDVPVANVVEEYDFHAGGFEGAITGGAVVDGDLVADVTDSLYGADKQSFYGLENDSFYAETTYAEMSYVSNAILPVSVLAGSKMTAQIEYEGKDLMLEYRLSGPGPMYGADSDSLYGADDEPFYSAPSEWISWPGQLDAESTGYQWRVMLGAGAQQGKIKSLNIVIDAPDIVEYLEDVEIGSAGTVIPYTSNFTVIKTVTSSLQAKGSGAVTIDVDKTSNLAPVATALNASFIAVSGASSDFILKGY